MLPAPAHSPTHQRRCRLLVVRLLAGVAVKDTGEGIGLPPVATLVGLAASWWRNGDGALGGGMYAVLGLPPRVRRPRRHRRSNAHKNLWQKGKEVQG